MKSAVCLAYAALLLLASAGSLRAQDATSGSATAALLDTFSAACRQQAGDFASHLPEESVEAYRNLSQALQVQLMQRIVAVPDPGKPLRSSGNDGTAVFRCTSPSESTEMRLGRERTRGSLAFIPVTLPSGRTAEFGLVHETTGWHLLSLGLLMIDVPQLAQEWAAQETAARESRAVASMRQIAAAVETYRRGFGSLPETLAQLGPAPKEGASPDAANLIGAELAAGRKDNYSFRYRLSGGVRDSRDAAYEIVATPITYGPGGKRSFYLDSSGTLRGADKKGDVAGPDDPQLNDRLEELP